MIESEVLRFFSDPSGNQLQQFVDEFRCGRDTNELMPLLKSNNAELASIGAWVLGELPFSLYSSVDFELLLRGLLEHPDASVRFHALGALFPVLEANRTAAQALLEKMRNDPNHAVRKSAESAMSQLLLK
jgi:hypothetical protein